MRDHLNQQRRLEAFRPEVRYREDIWREHAKSANCPPISPEVQARLDEMEARHESRYDTLAAKQARVVDVEFDEELEPFAPHIFSTLFAQGFKIPLVPPYDGTIDPYHRLNTLNTVIRASNVSHELMCMLFPTCLTGPGKSWFDQFRMHSIISWDQLSSDFNKQFERLGG